MQHDLTYATYLKTDELLALQSPLSDEPEHDETLFIVIHQVYELWFKQMLHEVSLLQNSLESQERTLALKTMHRMLTILKTMVAQVDILETMTPLSFVSFRDRLKNSSGFQSSQFRMFEVKLGKRDTRTFSNLADNYRIQIEEQLSKNTLWDSFLKHLSDCGIKISPTSLQRDRNKAIEPDTALQETLIDIYKKHPDLAEICERMVDLDEGLQEWRYRHVKMVERTIGVKMGTGGSPGAAYLKTTLFTPLYPDLWDIRSRF
ncbi:MAG: tryptophan 2,3-dioxygenase [Bdellovibrionales bacterium CG10_big_fil_rev_8_21_14_0_10_45_34]|nr:MAG: tryptophan 2,3-dioxygenase [Bdellovibrionales bacterium CG10_big_fil_rev_8_21_14_0_10_45_34]